MCDWGHYDSSYSHLVNRLRIQCVLMKDTGMSAHGKQTSHLSLKNSVGAVCHMQWYHTHMATCSGHASAVVQNPNH